jgi:hypothetical protein
MFRLRLPSLALPFLLLTMAPALDAQTAYRCEENGRVVFSDKPCPGGTPVDTRPATGSTSTTPPRSAAPTSAPPATPPAVPAPKPATVGTAPAKTTPAKPEPTKAAAPVGPGYQTREQACAEGSQKACDEIACLRDDTEACARIGGSVRGSGWYEIARKRETRSGKNDRGQTTLQRVLVLTIRCTGPQQRSGDIALGRGTITLANSSVNYSSVDTAAAALCKR